MIFEHEAKAMSEASGIPYQRIKARPHQLSMVMAGKHTGSPCPFLEKGRCSIYEARPLICRIHHSLEVSASTCEFNRATPDYSIPVEMIDPDHFEVPYAALARSHFKNEPWGAIQEFFPQVTQN
jgi:Fe-S-cluster containining protein